MKSNNYITLKTQVRNKSLTDATLRCYLLKNNKHYFNDNLIHLKVTHDDTGKIIKEVAWRPQKSGLPDQPVYQIETIDVYETQQVLLDIHGITCDNVNVDNRTRYHNVTVQVYHEVTDHGVTYNKEIFLERVMIETLSLPEPKIHSFDVQQQRAVSQEDIVSDIVRYDVTWSTMLPHLDGASYYRVEVLCDLLPGSPIFETGSHELAAHKIEFTAPYIGRGKESTMTLNIYRNYGNSAIRKKVFDTASIKVRFPAERNANTGVKRNDGKYNSIRGAYIAVPQDEGGTRLQHIACIYKKYGGSWYK